MEQMEIARRLTARFPEHILTTCSFQGQVSVITRREDLREMLAWLKDHKQIRLNHLMCLCGVDNLKRLTPPLERFEVVYALFSVDHGHQFRVRAQVPAEDPVIESITALWQGANWPERECYDLLGITFTGHPQMERVLLPEDWIGHPLRKEYPLKGREEWPGFQELRHKVQELGAFDFDATRTAVSRQKQSISQEATNRS